VYRRLMSEPVELKTVPSMPGSINELISTNRRLRRPPSLSESFAWEPENVARAQAQLQPLMPHPEAIMGPVLVPTPHLSHWKHEKYTVELVIKLLLHITLISVFETLFYFLYVSSLENNGIIKTVGTFIDGAATGCKNMSSIEIEVVNDILGSFLNATEIVSAGNLEATERATYNKSISNQAWYYVGAVSALFGAAIVYVRVRKIDIAWKVVILENVAMVCLLALYELMFFDTIIYPYEPISTKEIGRNAIQELQQQCGLLTA
jgi:hypothetical protein